MEKAEIMYQIPYKLKQEYKILQEQLGNSCADSNLYNLLYSNDNLNNLKKFIDNFLINTEFITNQKIFKNKTAKFKQYLLSLPQEIKIFYVNKLIDINDINSVFIEFPNIGSSIRNIYLLINNEFILYKYINIDIDKKYTSAINNLGFLCRYQYNIMYNTKLHFYIRHEPDLLTTEYLKTQLYEYCSKHPQEIKRIVQNWILPEFTDEDRHYLDFISAKELLKIV